MSNADYSCQTDISRHFPHFHVPQSATVVGTGGFGAWAAVFLARAGVERLCLVNPAGGPGNKEDVQGREIAIGPYHDRQLGMAKVDALEEILSPMCPHLEIVTHKEYYVPQKTAEFLDGHIFAGVSNADVLRGIFDDANAQGLRCVAGAYFGTDVGCYSEYPRPLSILRNAPVWVGSAALSAQLAVHSACVREINYDGDLSELRTDIQVLAKIDKEL